MSSFWKSKKVLVTGAAGFVGSALIETLVEKKAHVIAFVRDHSPTPIHALRSVYSQLEQVQGDLADFASVERAINEYEVDTVFHLGAQAIVQTALRSPLSTFESNIRGTYNLLEACHRHKSLVKAVVVASSDKAYGPNPILPLTEEMPLCGKSPYDVSKSCADLISLSYFSTYRLPVVVARCGNIFGPGDLHWNRLIPGTVRSFLLNEEPIIRSSGKFTRDYIYIADAIDAYLLLAENCQREDVRGEAFNFAPNSPSSVLEIVSTLQKLMGCSHLQPKIQHQAHGEIQDQLLSFEKARALLNWSPKFSLEEGLCKTIEWYTEYLQLAPL
jgi:CDP-glucose 4,6-dehydratase